MGFRASIHGALEAVLTLDSEFNTPQWQKLPASPVVLEEGTGDYQANKLFYKKSTLTSGSAETHDLRGAATTTDPFGTALTFGTVKALIFRASADNTTNLTIGNGTNPFVGPFGGGTHTLSLQPGGIIVLVAPKTGWTSASGTSDDLKVTNGSGASATYSVTVIGS